MTLAAEAPAPVTEPTSAPTQYVVPRVQGDPAAARALAAAYRELAHEVGAAARTAAQLTADLSATWSGRGRQAAAHPAEVLQRNATVTTRALHDAADALDAYAHKLETAHHHHFFSLHKLMAVAAVVTVTAVAVVVTMGAAAAAEAALAASAAGEATAAAGAAAAASTGAASGLLESTAGLMGIRALLSFALPHLVQAELSAGFAATMEESVEGRLDWHEIGTAGAAGFAGSAGAAGAARVAASVKFAKETWPLLHLLMPHVGQAVAWAGVDAGQQAAEGHLSLRELLLTAGMAGAGSALGARPIAVARAYLARQTVDEMLTRGVLLEAHEGPALGHTLAKHVNVTDEDLRQRFAVEPLRHELSRFDSPVAAQRAISAAIRANRESILAFAAGSKRSLAIDYIAPDRCGTVMTRAGAVTTASHVFVVLRRDVDGVFVKTSFLEAS